LKIKCVLCFLYNIFLKSSHSKKNSARFCYESKKVSMLSVLYSSQIFMKLEFSRQISVKSSNIKFYEDP